MRSSHPILFCANIFFSRHRLTGHPKFLRLIPYTLFPIPYCHVPEVHSKITAVILSERGPRRTLQPGGGESKDLRLFL
jgi:hypothetical protein